MRILLLCKDMDCGGAQTHVLELATHLSARGNCVCVASAGGGLVEKLEGRAIRHVTLPAESKRPAALVKLYRALKLLISEGFDVVHAHTRISALLADGICRSGRICFVTTIHARFKMNAFFRRTCRWGEAQIAVSRDLYFYLLENAPYVSDRALCVINNGIDTRTFSPENLHKDPNRRGVTVLFLSRLDKSCSSLAFSLCRLAPKLWREYPGIRMIIGGGGDAFGEISVIADEIEKKTGVRVVNTVGRVDNVLEFLSRGDIFIGASRAALEAMACGLPSIIGGDEGFLGIADQSVLKRGEYSNFCCRGERKVTDEELFDALLRLVCMSENKRDELARGACEYVREHHSAEQMAGKTEDFYKKALKNSEYREKNTQNGGTLLCGYYGFGNMGDELMLESAIRRAERECGAGQCNIRFLSRSRRSKPCPSGVGSVRRSSPFAVIQAIKHADKVVFGGGTLLQNSTSRRSLVYYLALLKCAQFFGKRTELWGNGIGAIRGERSRRAVAKVLRACEFVGVRDEVSMRRVHQLCGEAKADVPAVVLEKDMALDLCFSDVDDLRTSDAFARLGLSPGQKIAVFSVKGGANKKSRKVVFECAEELLKKGITPIFAVMYPAQDLALSRKFCKLLDAYLAYPFGADDMVALMRGAECVCSMRYHALVLSHIAGTSFIGVGDDQKIKSFCSGYGGEYIDAKKTGR